MIVAMGILDLTGACYAINFFKLVPFGLQGGAPAFRPDYSALREGRFCPSLMV